MACRYYYEMLANVDNLYAFMKLSCYSVQSAAMCLKVSHFLAFKPLGKTTGREFLVKATLYTSCECKDASSKENGTSNAVLQKPGVAS